VPAALIGATRCCRCGRDGSSGDFCGQCGTPWAGSLSESGTARSPLNGVVRAGIGRRTVAHGIDAVVPVALLALALAQAIGSVPGPTPWWLALLAAVLLVMIQALVVAVTGRSVGRLVMGQRTVDDLTGTPVRVGRFVARVGQPGWHRHLVTADLRRGRDPWEITVAPAAAGSPVASGAIPAAPVAGAALDRPAPPLLSPHSRARSSAGIVLDTGERYEIETALLLGRNPVDPQGGGDRALLAWPDLTRRLAKTHVLLEWSGSVLWVTDLHSGSGTSLVAPGGERQLLAPGVRSAAATGTTIDCGGRNVKVVAGG